MSTVFEAMPKIARLSRTCTVSEKIDGTNASICFRSGTHSSRH